MLVPLNWLKEFINIDDIELEKLSELLTSSGIEVASIKQPGKNLKDIYYGYVKEVQEATERLNICKVDCGAKGEYQCVTTDKTIITGDYVAYAIPGAVIANGQQVTKRSIKNIESEGMMLSVLELGLAESAANIWRINDSKLTIGADLIKILNLDDYILEIEITPNRSDCLSILGLAYHIAAVTGRKVKKLNVNLNPSQKLKTSDKIKISIKDYNGCPKYTGRYIENVKIQNADALMQTRLYQAGQRAINNVVDITNYVLLELGQPLHSFDYEHIGGSEIIVRLANENEIIQTLDGAQHKLSKDVLVIADKDKPIAVAGVMGGSDSEVTNNTARVLLESAYFNPLNIRKSSRLLGFSSESSYRFERGVDYSRVNLASDRAIELLYQNCPDVIISDCIYEVAGNEPQQKIVKLRYDRIEKILGLIIPREKVKEIINNLSFEIIDETQETIAIKIPFRRVDIEREIDIIEELAVLNGYDKIPSTAPSQPLTLGAHNNQQKFINNIIQFFANKGIYEAINYSFIDPDLNRDFTFNYSEEKVVKINNPLGREISVMRASIIPSMIKTIQNNYKYRNTGNNFFEVGKKYENININELPKETNVLAGAISEILQPLNHDANKSPNFFCVKGLIENLFEIFHIENCVFSAENINFLQPGQSALIKNNNEIIGILGKIHPDFANKYDIPEHLYLFEIDIDALLKISDNSPKFKEFSRYPFTIRDMSLLIPKTLEYSIIAQTIKALNIEILESFELASIYEHESIGLENRGI